MIHPEPVKVEVAGQGSASREENVDKVVSASSNEAFLVFMELSERGISAHNVKATRSMDRAVRIIQP